MELIDVYVAEVGARLPEKSRADIEKELRTMIEDTLEDESSKQGRPVDEAMVVDVLKRLGPPQKMAASYLPPRYLIGPDLYPNFIKVLSIVLSVVAVLAVLGLGVSLGASATTPNELGNALLEGVGGVFNTLIQAFGIVVIIFAILQLTVPGFKLETGNWDPRKMHAEPDPERVKVGEAVLDIVLSTLAILLFNLYPEWVGFSNQVNGEWVHVSLLQPAFLQFVPFLTLVWALDIGLNVWLIVSGRWSNFQRWMQVILNVANIILLLALLVTPGILALDPTALAAAGSELSAAQVQRVNEAINMAARVIIGIVVAVTALETVKQLYKLTLRGRVPAALQS